MILLHLATPAYLLRSTCSPLKGVEQWCSGKTRHLRHVATLHLQRWSSSVRRWAPRADCPRPNPYFHCRHSARHSPAERRPRPSPLTCNHRPTLDKATEQAESVRGFADLVAGRKQSSAVRRSSPALEATMPAIGPYSRPHNLMKVDGRTMEARLIRETREALIAHVGGAPSATA